MNGFLRSFPRLGLPLHVKCDPTYADGSTNGICSASIPGEALETVETELKIDYSESPELQQESDDSRRESRRGTLVMAVPFRDLRQEDNTGIGRLSPIRWRRERAWNTSRSVLGQYTHGEPVDFAFSRIDVPASFLWRAGEARRHADPASLAAILFQACPKAPASPIGARRRSSPESDSPRIFSLTRPLCRVAEGANVLYALGESSIRNPPQLNLSLLGGPAAQGRLAHVSNSGRIECTGI